MQQQQPYTRLSWRDRSGTKGYTYNWVRAGGTVSSIGAALDSWGSLLASVSDCVLVERVLFFNAIETSPPSPTGLTLSSMAAVFTFSTTEPSQFGMFWLPATNPALALTTGKTAGLDIDRTLPAVASLIAELTNGQYCNPFGYVLVACLSAFYVVLP